MHSLYTGDHYDSNMFCTCFMINLFSFVLSLSSSSVYSPFSDRVGPPPHNTPFPGVSMKSIGVAFL